MNEHRCSECFLKQQEIERLRAALREIAQLTVDHTYSNQVAEIVREALEQ